MKIWIVEWFDDESEDTLKSSFPNKIEAERWIKMKTNQERYDHTGFEVVSEPYESYPMSLNESMKVSDKNAFYKKLQSEKVRFQYHKKDGSIRKAYGTLIADELPEPQNPSDSKRLAREKLKKTAHADSVFYYDLDKHSFRCFKMKLFDKYL